MKPTTAVIFAAGIGSRMLPITAAVQKELLPIGNRPVVDYTVADLVEASITHIVFVVRQGHTGLRDFYLGNQIVEDTLKRLGKIAELKQLKAIQTQALFQFVEQSPAAGYGTAVPLRAAMPLLNPSEPVIVCSGDDMILSKPGASEMKAFVKTFIDSKAAGAIMAYKVPSATAQYHHLETVKRGGMEYLTNIVEQPTAGHSKSALVNVSKYILSGDLRDYVRDVIPRPENSELYITDAIVAGAQNHPVAVHHIAGRYLDTGNPRSWLEANQALAAGDK